MKRAVKVGIGAIACVSILGIGASLIHTYTTEKGITYSLTSDSLVGKIEELDSVLKEKVKLSSDTILEDIEIDLYKEETELLMAGQVYNSDTESKTSWSYFGSDSTGSIHTDKVKKEEAVMVQSDVTWETFLNIIKAVNLDEIVSLGGDHVGILYLGGETMVSKEEKEKTYCYDNIEVKKDDDGNIRKLGYYLYQDGVCTPIEDMSSMDGTYRSIAISFSDKGETASYRGVARLEILIP